MLLNTTKDSTKYSIFLAHYPKIDDNGFSEYYSKPLSVNIKADNYYLRTLWFYTRIDLATILPFDIVDNGYLYTDRVSTSKAFRSRSNRVDYLKNNKLVTDRQIVYIVVEG
jgi:hypothetical protein